LFLNKIFLKSFRNYAAQEIAFREGINIFYGENAQGKTNLLEAIYLLSLGRPYRVQRDQDLVKWEEAGFLVKGIAEKDKRTLIIEVSFTLGGKKAIKINGLEQKKLRALLGLLNVVIFSPTDLQLIQGSPGERRRFLDLEISQVNPQYGHYLHQYGRVLQQRNNLLRELRERKKNLDLLVVWDTQLIDWGSKIIKKRLDSMKKLSILAKLMHRKITSHKETLELKYLSSCRNLEEKIAQGEEIEHIFKQNLEKIKEEEIHRGMTMIGPHRDDFSSFINGINVKTFGSQGQQRTAVLSLKLAELEFMKAETGEYPLLLLDDVMSELDQERREHLLKVVRQRIQTFITTTDLEDFPQEFLTEASLYQISKGQISGVKGCIL